ncbi:MAG TPA: carboxylesterase family protein [Polyangiales bacterium]|nr:carboxylesterase family protein [Polyangiales bacterium]
MLGCFTVTLITFASCGEAASHVAPAAAVSGVLLSLPDGPVRGRSAAGTRSFIGIPYAAAPVGARRWQAPQPVEPWSETFDATGPGVACMQSAESGSRFVPQSEDCLRLNVFAPLDPPEKPVPVMVWLHGGSNELGSANDFIDPPRLLGASTPVRRFDGAAFRDFAEREVVVVTLNYRLGALGFLAHPALSTEAGTSGNYGLLDQQAALRWVQRNIAAFGGDPDRVTLFGQEAGAIDICYHLVAAGSQGLFHAAVLQSGSCGAQRLPRLAAAENQAEITAASLGCAGLQGEASLACLRALPAETFQHATPTHDVARGALAVIDGQFLREQPAHALSAGRFEQVPLIIGNDVAEDDLSCAARQLAARVSRFASVYLYSFARSAAWDPWPSTINTGSGIDELWVWNVFPALTPYAADDVSLSLQMRGYWTQLVDGDVNTASPRWPRPDWPRYELGRESELVLDLNIASADGLRVQRCQGCESD